jgi:flagellar biosynthesis component FlhA
VLGKVGGWIKSALVKAWGQLKKLPGWVFFVVLLLGGLLYFYISRLSASREKLKLQQDRVKLQREKEVLLKSIDAREIEELERVYTDYGIKIKALDRREKKLDAIKSKGPVEIANEWKKYLERR